MATKFFSDCEQTKLIADKFIVLTKTAGEDYKIAFADVIENLKQTLLRDYLTSKLGNLHINNNVNYADQLRFNDGYLEYLLLNGQTIKKTDYPDLFTKLGITTDTYTLANYGQKGGCTLRSVPNGSGRSLNTYEEDAIKSHLHNMKHNHTSQAHNHGMSHQHSLTLNNSHGSHGNGDWARFSDGDAGNGNSSANTAGGRNVTDSASVVINNYEGNTAETGGTETRMKNIAVQCYITARVII